MGVENGERRNTLLHLESRRKASAPKKEWWWLVAVAEWCSYINGLLGNYLTIGILFFGLLCFKTLIHKGIITGAGKYGGRKASELRATR